MNSRLSISDGARRFEPLSYEEEFVVAIGNNDPGAAAAWLRRIECAGEYLAKALRDMLGGNAQHDRHLRDQYPLRLRIASWGVGAPKQSWAEAEPATPDMQLIAALCANDVIRAVQLLEVMSGIGRFALDAMADMLDGDPERNPELKQCYARRLKIAPWQIAGRRRLGDNAKLVAKPRRNRKSPRKSRLWKLMMARRVQRGRDDGLSREEAIEAARNAQPFPITSGLMVVPPSYQSVEKAYDRTTWRRVRARKTSPASVAPRPK